MNESEDLDFFKNFDTEGDREEFLEALSVITDKTSRRILNEAASLHSPISINQFSDISQIVMARYLHLLTHARILKSYWVQGTKKFDITPFGRNIASLMGHRP